jgi:hypothetical protein
MLNDLNQIHLTHQKVSEKLQTGIADELRNAHKEKEQDRKNVNIE